MRRILFCALLTGCVNGRDLIAPEDAQYAALCVDSTYTDSTTVCWEYTTIEIVIVIENPNPR